MQVLAATSESTLEEWLSHLQASVTAHTPPEAMEAKAGAARLLRPLMLAQMHSEGARARMPAAGGCRFSRTSDERVLCVPRQGK